MPHNCWMISSTIHTRHGLITPQDRYLQTLETIHTIKSHDAHAHVILVDNSSVSLTCEQIHHLQSGVNQFFWVGDRVMNRYVNKWGVKGAGECHMLLLALHVIIQDQLKFDRIFKISGRYQLQPAFHVSEHDHPNHWCFKRAHVSACGAPAFDTRLWSMCGTLVPQSQQLLRAACMHHVTHNCTLECAMHACINLTRVIQLDRVYCEGHIAPWNQLIQD
jgi:hypothetical protein